MGLSSCSTIAVAEQDSLVVMVQSELGGPSAPDGFRPDAWRME